MFKKAQWFYGRILLPAIFASLAVTCSCFVFLLSCSGEQNVWFTPFFVARVRSDLRFFNLLVALHEAQVEAIKLPILPSQVHVLCRRTSHLR